MSSPRKEDLSQSLTSLGLLPLSRPSSKSFGSRGASRPSSTPPNSARQPSSTRRLSLSMSQAAASSASSETNSLDNIASMLQNLKSEISSLPYTDKFASELALQLNKQIDILSFLNTARSNINSILEEYTFTYRNLKLQYNELEKKTNTNTWVHDVATREITYDLCKSLADSISYLDCFYECATLLKHPDGSDQYLDYLRDQINKHIDDLKNELNEAAQKSNRVHHRIAHLRDSANIGKLVGSIDELHEKGISNIQAKLDIATKIACIIDKLTTLSKKLTSSPMAPTKRDMFIQAAKIAYPVFIKDREDYVEYFNQVSNTISRYNKMQREMNSESGTADLADTNKVSTPRPITKSTLSISPVRAQAPRR